MKDEERFAAISDEIRQAIIFHQKSSGDIEAKAKYWMTFLLPLSIGLMAYNLNEAYEKSFIISNIAISIAASSVVAIFCFSVAILSGVVDDGRAIPRGTESEPSWKICLRCVSDDSDWQFYKEGVIRNQVTALHSNDKMNARKSEWLSRGELTLFLGLPLSVVITSLCAVFLDRCSIEGDPSSSLSGGIGASIAFASSLLILFVRHIWQSRSVTTPAI